MPSETIDDATVIRYLLDDLSEEASENLEEAYFSDTGLFELVCEAEDRLIRTYLDGALSSSDSERFERKYYRLPELREKVAFTRNLRLLAEERRTGRLRPGGWLSGLFANPAIAFRLSAGLAAVGLFSLVLTSITLYRAAETERRAQAMASAIAAKHAGAALAPANKTLIAVLKPGILKGANDAPRWITVSAAVREISLQFDLPGVREPFQAQIEIYRLGDTRRALVAAQSGLDVLVYSGGASVTATFSSGELEAGDYLAYVKRDAGTNIAESYEFGIARAASSIQ